MSNAAPEAAPAPAKSRLPTKLIAVAVIGAIIVVECVVAALYLPFPSKLGGSEARAADAAAPQATGTKPAAAAASGTAAAGPAGTAPGDTDHIEVDLGDFRVSSFQTSTNITLRIEFKLHATVLASQQPEFERLFGLRKNRIRDLVNSVIREASMNDLNEPGLGLIKRKVLETVNQSLGQPLLQSIVFGEFTFTEQ